MKQKRTKSWAQVVVETIMDESSSSELKSLAFLFPFLFPPLCSVTVDSSTDPSRSAKLAIRRPKAVEEGGGKGQISVNEQEYGLAAEKDFSFINGGSILDWIGLDSPERRQRQRVPVDYKLMLSQAQTGGFFFLFLFCPRHKEAFPSFYIFSLVYLFIFQKMSVQDIN